MSPGRLRFHRYLPNSPRVFYTSLHPHTCYRAHGRIAGRDSFDAIPLCSRQASQRPGTLSHLLFLIGFVRFAHPTYP
jgi:hypothetical protein